MTAVCLYRADDQMVFAADGLSYDLDGTVLGYVTKLYPIPHLGCVFTHAGAGRVGVVMIDLINRGLTHRAIDTFDALVEMFEHLCREAHSIVENGIISELGAYATELHTKATFIVGGWSEARQRYVSIKTSSYDKEVYGGLDASELAVTPAWTVQEIEGFYINSWPGSDPDVAAEFQLLDDGVPILDLMARAICACRATSHIDEDGVYCVGGFIQMVHLTPAKVTSWIAHRWPDPVGQAVDTTLGDKMPSFPIEIP